MNFNTLKVVVRTEDTFISLGLELENQRAFAVIYEDGIKDANAVLGKERMELDVRFLQEMSESEYLYKQLVELPGPDRTGRVMLNPESDRDSRSERNLLGH
jgi:hypothetical protein